MCLFVRELRHLMLSWITCNLMSKVEHYEMSREIWTLSCRMRIDNGCKYIGGVISRHLLFITIAKYLIMHNANFHDET